jgi:NAD(P)-dependent dehydrogenase (short-subunit alcohol dehydrogenase family)
MSSNNNLFDVNGKVVIVTGANRGNGLAISEGLAELGAKVIRVDKKFDKIIGSYDVVFDLKDISKIKILVDGIVDRYGSIDGLVNNAGVSGVSGPAQDPYDDNEAYNTTFDINLHAPFKLCAEVCKVMARSGCGSIVNITSLGAKLGFPNNPSYQMTKSALQQLTKAIAYDWSPKGIRINNICPGYIKTKMTEKSFNDEVLNKDRLDRMLIKRWGEPEDLVGPTVFLLSNASSYITGSDVVVDGGWLSGGL